MRPDVKTPEIDAGYADVIIGLYKGSKPMRGEIAFNEIQLL